MKTIRAFWHASKNFGDTLTPFIVRHFTGLEVEKAGRNEQGKLLAVGSIMTALRPNDVVWGSGSIRPLPKGYFKTPGVKYLAVRGPLTRAVIGDDVPEVYGDPGILLPLIFFPDVKKTHKVGIMPHSIDKPLWQDKKFTSEEKFIDIDSGWQNVIREVLSVELLLTSSLHGIVCANAYGVPVVWEKYSDKIIGGEFKFQDYFAGVGIKPQHYGALIPQIVGLKQRQAKLASALQTYFLKCK